jgi:ABC-type lipoprotein export system ATPase subunit
VGVSERRGPGPLWRKAPPTAELDSHASEALLQVIHGLAEKGQSVVLSTHDPQAIDIADKTLYLRHGILERVAEHGSRRSGR